MPRETEPATIAQSQDIACAIRHLKIARKLLNHAESPQAARKVRRALKSSRGALRDVQQRIDRSLRR